MPISPSPGRGISTAGINKTAGWGSMDANGGLIPGHEGDQGINHLAGLSEGGLDTSTAPYARLTAATGIAATTATLNWTSIPACPAGSVKYRLAGSSGAYTTVAEAAGTKTAHSIPLTGLTAGKTYEFIVTQPSWVVGPPAGIAIDFSGRIHTTGGTELLEGEGQSAPMSSGLDGATTPPVTPEPTTPPEPTSAEVTGIESGLVISAYTVDTDPGEIIALWRTDAYADGSMELVNTTTNQATTVTEPGNKRMNHEVVATGLEPNTTYLVRVTSTDAAGDTATSDVQEVTTPA